MSNGSNAETAPSPRSARATTLSDWAPWIVLVALLTFGFAGTLGLVPISVNRAPTSTAHTREVSQTPATAAPLATATSTADPAAPESVLVRHVLVQHKRAWRVDHEVTLTVEQAKERAEEARKGLLAGEDFYKVLADYSNSPEVVVERGVLPRLKRGDGLPGIGDAAFSLKIGGVSSVVQTPFGFHVLQRTE